MVKHSGTGLDAVFGALADPTRRAILARLAQGHTSLSELAQPFLRSEASDARRSNCNKMSLVALQKHVRVLERAGLVETEKEGRVRRCAFQPAPLRTAAEWIEFYQKFWEDQFDALEQFMEDMQKEDPTWRPQSAQPESRSGAATRKRRW